MKLSRLRLLPLLPSAMLMLGGCTPGDSSGGSTPAATTAAVSKATAGADAARKLETYRQLLRIPNDEMAVTVGHDILDHYPESAAAKEVQQSLPPIEQRWKENSEKTRLAAVWHYQVSPMQGGTQSTATAYSSTPPGNDRVRLVLRRHTAWGQNAFLYGGGHGFVCRGNCALPATFDGKRTTIKAFAPTTGEPALMIRDDKSFIARLEKSHKITIDVVTVDGEKKETLLYEIGGFDPGKWAGLRKSKDKRK